MLQYILQIMTPTINTSFGFGILLFLCSIAITLLLLFMAESQYSVGLEFLIVVLYLTALFYCYSSLLGIVVNFIVADVVLKVSLVIMLSILLTLLTSASIIKLYENFRNK